MKTHYIDLAAYRRQGYPAKAIRRHPAAPTDWLSLCAWLLTLAIGLSFWAYVYLLVNR